MNSSLFRLTLILSVLSLTKPGIIAEELSGPIALPTTVFDTPYEQWLARTKHKIPFFEGILIEDIHSIALKPWPKMGRDVQGLYLRFADYQVTDGRILEIPPRGATASQRHLFEMDIYILGGSGYSLIQQVGSPPQRLEWKKGSLFSIPLNVRYGHFNDSDSAVRLLSVTSFSLVINVFNNERFAFENPYQFDDRFDGSPDYFTSQQRTGLWRTRTNFVENVMTWKTRSNPARGKGNQTASWDMAGNSILYLHLSKFLPLSYKKAHRHSSEAFILVLSGQGYSWIWSQNKPGLRRRVDWGPGTLFVPPNYWYHQHFNPGSETVRYLALQSRNFHQNLGLYFQDQLETESAEIISEWQKEIDH